MRLFRVPEAASPKLNPMPTFECDSNGLLSEIERVCAASNMEVHVEVRRPAERTCVLEGRISK